MKTNKPIMEMIPEQTTMVSISLDHYKSYILQEAFLVSMIQAAYSQASLSYDKKRLSLDDTSLENFLRTMDADRYWSIYQQIKDQIKGVNDGENESEG